MPSWALAIDDWLFRLVTQGAASTQVAVFLPLGLAAGLIAACWSARLIARESAGARGLSRGASMTIVLVTAAIDLALVLAVGQGQVHAIPEGGSVDWAHWRLLYHYALIVLLVTATAIDFDQYLIPDEITVPGTLLGLAGAFIFGQLQLMHVWIDWNQADPIFGPYIPQWIKQHPHWHALAWSLAGLTVGAGITWLARAVSRGVLGVEALGFGDVTLMAMIGSFLGWQPMVFVFLLAPICGLAIGLAAKIVAGRRAIPYGPCLSFAALLVNFTWRWLWPPTRDIFGHWPTLVGLATIVIVGTGGLLWLLLLYRSIPVTRRNAPK